MEVSRFERTLLFNRINVTFRWRKLHNRWMMEKLEEIVGFEGRKSQQEIQQMPGAWVLSCPASCQWGWHMLAAATRWQKEESPKKVCDEKSFFGGVWWFSSMTHRGIRMIVYIHLFFLLFGWEFFPFWKSTSKAFAFCSKKGPYRLHLFERLRDEKTPMARWITQPTVNQRGHVPNHHLPKCNDLASPGLGLKLATKNRIVFLFFSPPVN